MCFTSNGIGRVSTSVRWSVKKLLMFNIFQVLVFATVLGTQSNSPQALFFTRRDKYLAKSLLRSLDGQQDWLDCTLECGRDPGCISYNYYRKGRLCELNDNGVEQVGDADSDLLFSEGWSYHQIRVSGRNYVVVNRMQRPSYKAEILRNTLHLRWAPGRLVCGLELWFYNLGHLLLHFMSFTPETLRYGSAQFTVLHDSITYDDRLMGWGWEFVRNLAAVTLRIQHESRKFRMMYDDNV